MRGDLTFLALMCVCLIAVSGYGLLTDDATTAEWVMLAGSLLGLVGALAKRRSLP